MINSNTWRRLATLRPALPRHIRIQRRQYRGKQWYVLHDKTSGRFHRFNPSAYQLIGFMDGHNNLQQILQAATLASHRDSLEQAPSAEDLLELIQYLHIADLLICDIPPNTQELFRRRENKNKQKWRRLLLNPITWKFPLANPDSLLQRLLPLARILSHPLAGFVWLVVVTYALFQAANHWSELRVEQFDNMFTPQNMFWLWLTYPLLKVLHELGHALFTKAWGGSVHECGVVFIMGTPLPYVDASAATAFAKKSQRLMVSAAGMAVELFLAAVALLLWLQLENGTLQSLMYNIIILGSISTLFFNGNPLMRFDGYHLLCDAIDMPNLASRANQQISYLVQRYGYGLQGLHTPATTTKEAFGLVLYSISAFFYRLFILAFIILLATQVFPLLGAILGIWLLLFQLIIPIVKRVIFLIKSPSLQPTRRRALATTFLTTAALAMVFFYVPMPLSTRAEGVLWLPDNAKVRSESFGFVEKIWVSDGTQVTAGQALIQLQNADLISQLQIKKAALREYQARYQLVWSGDRAQAKLLTEDIRAIEAEIAHLQKRVDSLLISSPSSGRLNFINADGLPGSYLRQGDEVAIVVQNDSPRVRVALTQQEIGLVRQYTRRVEIKLADNLSAILRGSISQQVPAATFLLPSPVLGSSGGGRVLVDPQHATGTKAQQLIFLVDVILSSVEHKGQYGGRAHVLFRHNPKPWSAQLHRRVRQLFIKTLQR